MCVLQTYFILMLLWINCVWIQVTRIHLIINVERKLLSQDTIEIIWYYQIEPYSAIFAYQIVFYLNLEIQWSSYYWLRWYCWKLYVHIRAQLIIENIISYMQWGRYIWHNHSLFIVWKTRPRVTGAYCIIAGKWIGFIISFHPVAIFWSWGYIHSIYNKNMV